MKKSLLGLLALALAVVGCQNYDDQFDDLNTKIAALSSEVSNLSTIQSNVAALSTKLDNLASTALTDADLQSVLTEVADVKAQVAAISVEEDLAYVEEQVQDLDEEVALIIEKLNELLTANAVINQNVRITSLAELSLAEDLIATGADDPNVTINGSLVVNTTGASDITAAADVARLNAVMDKIKVVMKTVTVTADEALTAAALQYVQGNLDVNAEKGSLTAGALTTVTGLMEINQSGELLMPSLNSVAGGITIQTANVTITKVDFSGLTEGAARTAADQLILPHATDVKISGVLPLTVTCVSATTFVSNAQAAQTATTISIDGSTQFSLGSTSFSGQVTITATGGVNLAGVTSANALSITSGGDINLGGLTAISSATTLVGTSAALGSVATAAAALHVSATTLSIGALTSSTGVVTFTGPSEISVPLLATLDGSIDAANAATFAAPALSTTTGTINTKAGATVHLKSLNNPAKLLTLASVNILKLFEQTGVVSLVTAVKMTELDYTGKKAATVAPNSQETENALSVTAANASLTTLKVAGHLGTLTVDNSTLTSLSTLEGSVIITCDVKNNTALESFELNHTFLEGDNAITISVTGNTDPLFTALDMSSMTKVKHVNITGNTSLTDITAPSATTLAEPIAVVTVTINNNLVKGTYTKAVAGSETFPHTDAKLEGETVVNFKAFYDAYKAQTNRLAGTVTLSIEIDSAQADMAADAVAQTAGANQQLIGNDGLINDDLEVKLLSN